ILYYEGKEIHRKAKIINFQEIEKRVRQVHENS
ncbi:thioredoxin, partial [Enterococcus faecalis]